MNIEEDKWNRQTKIMWNVEINSYVSLYDFHIFLTGFSVLLRKIFLLCKSGTIYKIQSHFTIMKAVWNKQLMPSFFNLEDHFWVLLTIKLLLDYVIL